MHRKIPRIRYLLIIIAAIPLLYGLSESDLFKHYLANPEVLKNAILSLGILAPLAIILLQAFQTTISVIPSQLTTIVAGFVFGPFLGLLYSLIGAFIGSSLVFFLTRKYGEEIALKFFEKKDMVHFNVFFRDKKLWALFLARILPIFPNDLVSFTAALTGMKFRNFSLFSTFGFLMQMLLLTYFGSELARGRISVFLLLISLLVGLLLLVVLFKKRIKRILIKDIHSLEKEGRLVEKEFKKIKILF